VRIVVSTHSLEGLGGVETYVATLSDQLQRNGHEVWAYARTVGKGAELADLMGVRVVTSPSELPADLDAAIPQDAPGALEIFAASPDLPQIFVSHTELFDVGLPPQVPGAIQAIVTLYQRAHDRVVAQAVELPIERLRQPVDITRFKPTSVLAERPRRAVAFGNYVTGPRREAIERGCAAAGIEFEAAGSVAGGLQLRPEETLNNFDIVFGKGKIVHEAMGCGRAVYVLDHNGAEGWVTADNYELLVRDNFGGRSQPRPFTAESLAADLRNYDPAMGMVNRDLIVANHDATAHAADLTQIIRKYAGRGEQRVDAGNAAELARLVRVNWRHESDAFQLRRMLEASSLEVGDSRWRAEVAEAELAAERERSAALAAKLEQAHAKPLRRLARKLLR
jgi:hypothetical protein